MQYGELAKKEDVLEIINWHQPKYLNNDFSAMQKNWSFWEHDGRLFAAFQRGPDQLVLEIEDDSVMKEFRTLSPPCSFGVPRGGTHPIPFEDGLIQFFHTQTVNRKSAYWWNYSVGALVMDSKPPFQIRKISSHPIMVGTEQYFPNWKFCKPKVIIPFGAKFENGEYQVSIGINDSACAIATIKPEMLNL